RLRVQASDSRAATATGHRAVAWRVRIGGTTAAGEHPTQRYEFLHGVCAGVERLRVLLTPLEWEAGVTGAGRLEGEAGRRADRLFSLLDEYSALLVVFCDS